jgi:hypothetical protein
MSKLPAKLIGMKEFHRRGHVSHTRLQRGNDDSRCAGAARPFAGCVVVVDDGWKDATVMMAVEWMQGEGSGVPLRCPLHGGMSSALKAGL